MKASVFALCRLLLLLCASLLVVGSSTALIPGPAQGSVFYVDQNAPGPEHNGQTWDTAFLTIQEGVNAATPGGEVWVAEGTYVENIVMGEGVQLYGGFLGAEPGGYEDSLDERDWVNNVTTIDANHSGRCLWVHANNAGITVDGFTITNGAAGWMWSDGGGILLEGSGCDVAIRNNRIVSNVAGDGGGLYCYYQTTPGSLVISGNQIADNTATQGAGLWIGGYYTSLSVTGNEIVRNDAGTGSYAIGGGCILFLSNPVGATLIANNLFCGNSAAQGGGLEIAAPGKLHVVHNVLVGNGVPGGAQGGAVFAGDPCRSFANNIVAYNNGCAVAGSFTGTAFARNLFWRNGGGDVWFWGTEPGGAHDVIYADPGFADPETGDYHLAPDSPCIDQGSNEYSYPEDFDGDARPFGGDRADIGLDETQRQPPWTVVDEPTSDLHMQPGDSASFSGSAGDPNGQVTSVWWDFGPYAGLPPIYEYQTGPVRFDEPGAHLVTFSALDNEGNGCNLSASVMVIVGSPPPVYVDIDSEGLDLDGRTWETAYDTIDDGIRLADRTGAKPGSPLGPTTRTSQSRTRSRFTAVSQAGRGRDRNGTQPRIRRSSTAATNGWLPSFGAIVSWTVSRFSTATSVSMAAGLGSGSAPPGWLTAYSATIPPHSERAVLGQSGGQVGRFSPPLKPMRTPCLRTVSSPGMLPIGERRRSTCTEAGYTPWSRDASSVRPRMT